MWHWRAETVERPDGLLSEVGKACGEWIWGGPAQIWSDSSADHGRGEWQYLKKVLINLPQAKLINKPLNWRGNCCKEEICNKQCHVNNMLRIFFAQQECQSLLWHEHFFAILILCYKYFTYTLSDLSLIKKKKVYGKIFGNPITFNPKLLKSRYYIELFKYLFVFIDWGG